MEFGNKPSDGGHLLLKPEELASLGLDITQQNKFIRPIYGSDEFIKGSPRLCIWVEDCNLQEARLIHSIHARIEAVRKVRLASRDKGAHALARRAHQLKLMRIGTRSTIIVPIHTSENREFLPVGFLPGGTVVSNAACAIYDAPLWNLAVIASRFHLVWIATVCGKLKTDFRYSNTLGWNTFPVPTLTDKNKEDLTRCAEDILLTREHHFPATIADLYDPDNMPDDLRGAHERNDEVLERIYIGRRFKNDTERLEKLFDLYTRMTASAAPPTRKQKTKPRT